MVIKCLNLCFLCCFDVETSPTNTEVPMEGDEKQLGKVTVNLNVL